MAYIPLTQRVAEAIAKRTGTAPDHQPSAAELQRAATVVAAHAVPEADHRPSASELQHAVTMLRAQAAEKPAGFSWETPERTREMVKPQPAAKRNTGYQMSMAHAIRELKKLKRRP